MAGDKGRVRGEGSLMQKYGVIVADPPWGFNDTLRMSKTARGAAANYGTMPVCDIVGLGENLRDLTEPDCVLALWVPSALLAAGWTVLVHWGFVQKQIYTWVKTTKDGKGLAMGMGHHFRGATEHALIGTRGRPKPKNRAQRNVHLSPATPHSVKPEFLQDSLDKMYPDTAKLELFARRDRPGWTCVGNECPSTFGVDIRDWLSEKSTQ